MERLTDTNGNLLNGLYNKDFERPILRLAAYEDTGITPEQITKMQAENAKLRELLKMAEEDMSEIITDHIYTYENSDDYDNELCTRHCAQSGINCFERSSANPFECANFRWKHADEVEEVLRDDNIRN